MRLYPMILAAGLVAGLLPAPARADDERIEWHDVQYGVASRLDTEDVGEIARGLAAEKATSLEGRLTRLVVFVRADHAERARATIDGVVDADRWVLELACTWLITLERDDLALRLLEHRPELNVSLEYPLRRMVARDGLDATLAWLREREKSAPGVWLPRRARLLARHGSVEGLLDEVEKAVRAHPGDVAGVLRYLALTRDHGSERDVAWIGAAVVTSGPYEDLVVARELVPHAPRAAVRLLRSSLEREVGEADVQALQQQARQSALELPGERDYAALLRRETRHALLDALMAAGENEEAQRLMEALTREMEESGGTLPAPGWLERAGQIQRASGHRVIEQKVREEEQLSADDPAYWLKRSAYFTGRKEWTEALRAAERALELTPLGDDLWPRRRAVDQVRGLIHQISGEEAAFDFLRAELARVEGHDGFAPRDSSRPSKVRRVPAVNELADGIARDMAFDYHGFVKADDELLWRYLASVEALDHGATRLAWRMAENGGVDDDAFWKRLAAIVRAGEPRGRQRLGFVMIVTDQYARAIPFLQESLAVVTEDEHRSRCAFLIVRAGLESGDWRVAEEAWPVARLHLGPDERPDRLTRMALLAAKDGELAAALRFWQRKANYDHADMDGLEELAAVPGMIARLRAWYDELAKQYPQCGARARFRAAVPGE